MPRSSKAQDSDVSEAGDHTEAKKGTEQNLEEKQEPLAEDGENHGRASNDPREVKKMQRQKEIGINN